ncbi:hypothetical protein LTR53_011155 [Teratosphaeriaceae sp. CCFEE 6253]|nr:hypothetical protein LTR53_011155 [Teratosphaeriaceae sp. CCFEE 6253]
MDKAKENNPSNLWTRRSNSSKLSLSVNKNAHSDEPSERSTPKRYTSQSATHPKGNPFSAPLSSTAVASPTGNGASSAFGLGSGAFASFGSAGKTPKTPGSAFDFASKSSADKKHAQQQQDTSDRDSSDKEHASHRRPPARKSLSAIRPSTASSSEPALGSAKEGWPLKHVWLLHYRPPTGKNADYEKSIRPMCRIATVQDFWSVYTHIVRPSLLPTVSDYHFFREGIRPVWEDEENRRGGKWIMKLKKGVADRYWEELLMAMIGDQFMEASEEVCGAVVSVRQGEDVFSVWTKNDGGRNVKIRETLKRVLKLPPDTEVLWRSHGESITQTQESAKVRQEKLQAAQEGKRRSTLRGEVRGAEGGEEEGKA